MLYISCLRGDKCGASKNWMCPEDLFPLDEIKTLAETGSAQH